MNVLSGIRSRSLSLFVALVAILSVKDSRAASLPPMAFELPMSLSGGGIRDGVVDSEGNFAFLNAGTLYKYSRGGFQMFSQPVSTITAAALAAGPGGETYLAGTTGVGASLDLAVAKYAADGTLAWMRTAGGEGKDEAYDIVVDDQGGIYAAGYTTVDMSDAFVVKYNAEGVEQWTRRFNGSLNGDDDAHYVVAVPGGGIAACGKARNPSLAFLTIRYDAAGTELWKSFYNVSDTNYAAPVGLVRTSDGGFAVAGYTGAGVEVVRYSDAGNRLWHTPVPGATGIGGVAAGAGGEVAVITIGAMHYDTIGFPMIGPVSVSGVSETGVAWNVPLGESEVIGGPIVPGESGGYYATAGYSTRYHIHPGARLVGMKPGGADLSIEALPSYISNMLGGPVGAYILRSGADGSLWMIYNSPTNSTLFLRRYGVAVPPPVPGVVTGAVENLHRESAALTGQIDPKGAGLTWRFEYSYLNSNYSTPWRQLSGPGTVSVSEPVTGLFPVTYQYRLVVSNGAGTFYGESRTFRPLSAYQDWAASVFGSHNAPGTGPLDDPDGDGAVNLLEYALGSQANVPGGGHGAPVFELWKSPESGIVYPSMVYQQAALRFDALITPVASNDLINWTETGITVRNEGGVTRAVAQQQQRFLRLKVTLQNFGLP